MPTAPTEKELSIGLFKERYGGVLIPKVQWIAYADHGDLRRLIHCYADGLENTAVPWLSEPDE